MAMLRSVNDNAPSSSRPRFRDLPGTVTHVRRPSIVTSFVGAGCGSFVGLLQSDPTRVLKFPYPDEDSQTDIEQEKKIYGLLGFHKLIATVHQVSERGIFLEYYPLGTLRNYYETLNGALPPIDLRQRWCRQAVQVIAYIHSKGVVHNDISTRNILLAPDYDIKLCDFGFACMEGDTQHGRAETRYQRYRALTDFSVSICHDVFAIGSLFYEIFTGNPPYFDMTSDDITELYRDRRFPSLADVPPPYCRIAEKCWNDRYTSTAEILQELSKLETEGICTS